MYFPQHLALILMALFLFVLANDSLMISPNAVHQNVEINFNFTTILMIKQFFMIKSRDSDLMRHYNLPVHLKQLVRPASEYMTLSSSCVK